MMLSWRWGSRKLIPFDGALGVFICSKTESHHFEGGGRRVCSLWMPVSLVEVRHYFEKLLVKDGPLNYFHFYVISVHTWVKKNGIILKIYVDTRFLDLFLLFPIDNRPPIGLKIYVATFSDNFVCKSVNTFFNAIFEFVSLDIQDCWNVRRSLWPVDIILRTKICILFLN